MAEIYYSNYPAYVSAFNRVQKLSNRLYGMPGYGNGLDIDLLRAATENEGGENSAEYKRLKKIFFVKLINTFKTYFYYFDIMILFS